LMVIEDGLRGGLEEGTGLAVTTSVRGRWSSIISLIIWLIKWNFQPGIVPIGIFEGYTCTKMASIQGKHHGTQSQYHRLALTRRGLALFFRALCGSRT